MIPLLDDVAVGHKQDVVRIPNGGKAVGDDKAGSAVHELFHGLADLHLRTGIHAGGGLVQDQDGGIAEEHPGNGQQLALAGGEVGGFVVQHRVIALGHGADEVVHHGGLGSGHNLLAGGVRLAVGNVFRHGTAKQPGVLENHAEVAAQPAAGHLGGRDAVHRDFPAIDLVKPHQEVDQRGLPGPCAADYGDLLPWPGGETDVLHQQAVGVVAKADVLKGHVALGVFHDGGVLGVRDLLLLVQHFKGTLGGSQGGLEGVDHIGGLRERLCRLVHILEEGLYHTNGHGAVEHRVPGNDGDHSLGQPGQQTDEGVNADGEEVCLLVGSAVFFRNFYHLLNTLILVVVSLDDVAALIVLFHHARQGADGLLPLGSAKQVLRGYHLGDYHADGHEHQENQGEGYAVIEHDDQRPDDGANGDDHLQQTGLEDFGNLIQVAGDPAENLTGLVLVKEAQRQAVKLAGDLGSQGEHQGLGYAGHQIGLQVVEHPGKQVLYGKAEEFLPQVVPGNDEGSAGVPGCLDALPQVVDDHCAVQGIPNTQNHVDYNGDTHHSETGTLAPQLAEQTDHSAFGVLRNFSLWGMQGFLVAHASCASFVWDS